MIHLSAESCLLLNLGFGVLVCMLVHTTLLLAICEKVLKNQVEKVEKLYQISSNCQAVVAIPVLSISVHY